MASQPEKPLPNHSDLDPDDYGGLQVVETGLEVAPSALPEVAAPSDPEAYEPYHQKFGEHLGTHPAYGTASPTTPGGYSGLPTTPSTAHAYLGGRNPYDPSPPPTQEKPPGAKRRICGLRRNVFWVVLAAAVFVVVAAIAVGLGVGLATGESSDATAASNTTTPTATATPTNSLPAATSTQTAGTEVSITCPSNNRTLYSLSGDDASTSRRFLVLCGRDYNESDGAADLYSVNKTTFAGCLSECATQEACTAVGWGNYYGTNTCWLKSQVGTPNWSTGWYSAVEDDSG